MFGSFVELDFKSRRSGRGEPLLCGSPAEFAPGLVKVTGLLWSFTGCPFHEAKTSRQRNFKIFYRSARSLMKRTQIYFSLPPDV
jgi:hypothetical protein